MERYWVLGVYKSRGVIDMKKIVVFLVLLIALTACGVDKNYEPEIREIMPSNQEAVMNDLDKSIGTEWIDIQPNDARLNWASEGKEKIKELSDSLLPTVTIQGMLGSEKPKSYIEITYDEFKIIVPRGTENPEKKMALIRADDPKVISIKGDKEKVKDVIRWLESQLPE